MLEAIEKKQAEQILRMEVPNYRRAYSDRVAWLMAYMAELAYLKFDKPDDDGEITLALVERALRAARKGTVGKIVGALRKSYAYDYKAQEETLKDSLKQIGWNLAVTISENATQAFVAFNKEYAVLAFRGTEADRFRDIRADAKATQTACPTGGRVHSGFKEQYDDVASKVEAALAGEVIKGKPLFVTGHSLGGAVATIAARRLRTEHRVAACYTYGSPRVGTEEWVAQIKTPIYRIINSADPVPMVPFSATTTFWLVKLLRATGRTIPMGRVLAAFANWIARSIAGYTHAGNMRFLTDCKDGDMSKTELLYTVGWGRRFRGLLTRMTPLAKVLNDHSIEIYRRKMTSVAEKRNLES